MFPMTSLKFKTQAILSLLMLAMLFWLIDSTNRAFAEGKTTAPAESNVIVTPDEQTVEKTTEKSAPAFSIPTGDVRRIFKEAGPLMYAIALCSILVVTFFL